MAARGRFYPPTVPHFVGLPEAHRRLHLAAITRKIQGIVRPLPLGNGLKQAIVLEVKAAIDSYIALKREDKQAGWPEPQ